MKLRDRIESYQNATDYRLLNRVPLVITLNGKSFSKITSLLDKPYCPKFAECMFSTTLRLCSEVEGAVFAYHHNDEISIVVRNDQNIDTESWFDNRLQKICSVSSVVASLHFIDCASAINLNLLGQPMFTAQTFVVPNLVEAINTIIYKQQHNFHISIQSACFYELLKKYDKNIIKEMLTGLSIDEKIDLLRQESNIDFNNYPSPFRRGTASYKVPKVVDGIMKNKWHLNSDLPIFTRDQSFLSNIFKHGSDIFRASNL